MEELKKKFLKKLTDYENEKLIRSWKQDFLNYIVVNSETYEKIKKIINEKEK